MILRKSLALVAPFFLPKPPLRRLALPPLRALTSSSSTAAASSPQITPSSPSLSFSRPGLDPSLNRRHSPLVYHPHYSPPTWPAAHTFPMSKFRLLAKTITTNPVLNSSPLVASPAHFYEPLPAASIPQTWLSGPIDPDFVARFTAGLLSDAECRYIGFRAETTRPPLIERTLLEVGGTVLACQLALAHGVAANLAGGTHHAHATGGAGYTIINDIAVAAHVLTSTTRVKRVLVIDLDVHQGDGTAKFSAGNLQGRLFTLSLHCASNYPRLKAHSTFDVGLPDGMRDDEYLRVMEESVEGAIGEVEPDFVIYDAGVDVYEGDKLGRLSVSEDGIRRRDRWVLERCVKGGIPVAAIIGGGYDKDIEALARRHAIVHEECAYIWRKYEMWKKAGG